MRGLVPRSQGETAGLTGSCGAHGGGLPFSLLLGGALSSSPRRVTWCLWIQVSGLSACHRLALYLGCDVASLGLHVSICRTWC